MQYRHTHYSRNDGSPAMLVVRLNDTDVVLENEDGFRWVGPASQWLPYPDESEAKTCPPIPHPFHNDEYDAPK